MIANFHAETVGSLQRSDFLMSARAAHASGSISTADFKRVEDEAVVAALALQADVGLKVVTDGEQRRGSFYEWLISGVNGVSELPAFPMLMRGLPGHEDVLRTSPVSVTGRLSLKRSVYGEEFSFARGQTRQVLKVTVPSPMLYLAFMGPETSAAYPDPFDLFVDAAKLINAECRELARLGCQYIQIDAPELTHPADPLLKETFFPRRGLDADEVAERASDLLNIVTNVPGVEFAIHFCRGNGVSHYLSAAGYDAAVRNVCHRVRNVSTLLMEYDDERAGSLEFLRDIPDEKRVLLGLVSSVKRAAIEPIEVLERRIADATRYHPKENLGISPQCGFCSLVGSQGFDVQRQREKLQLVVEVARRVWG